MRCCCLHHHFHPLHRHLVVTFTLRVMESMISIFEVWVCENAFDDCSSYEIVLTQMSYCHHHCLADCLGHFCSACVLGDGCDAVIRLCACSLGTQPFCLPVTQPFLIFCFLLVCSADLSCEVVTPYSPNLLLSVAC